MNIYIMLNRVSLLSRKVSDTTLTKYQMAENS